MFNNFFGKKPTVKEQQRENDRALRRAGRDIEKERRVIEQEEKKIEMEIKKAAKEGNNEACKLLAKQLIAMRKQKQRTFAADSKIKSVGFQNKNVASNMALTDALATTSKTMGEMNIIMKPEAIAADMRKFQEANMKMEMTDEMINESLDDMLEDSDDEEETNGIVNKVLDEIGIEISGKMSDAPRAGTDTIGSSSKLTEQDIAKQLERLRSN